MLEPLRVDEALIRQQPLLYPLRRSPQIFDDEFSRFNRRSLAAACILTLAIFGLWLAARSPLRCGGILDCGWDIVGWLMLAGFVATVPLDFISLSSTVTVFGDMTRRGEWDLLTLANRRETDIIQSRHLLALARVWRPLALVTNVRIAVAGCLILWLAVQSFGVQLVIVIPVAAAFLSAFILEPRWRVRALTAVGLAVSSRVRQPTSAVLAGMVVAFAVWTMQIGIVGLLYWTLLQDLAAVAILCPMVYIATAGFLYALFWRAEKVALADAARRMECCADDLR